MSECKCSMSISLLGDGCEHCQPETTIANLRQWLEDERTENAELRAELFKAETERGVMFEEYDKVRAKLDAWEKQSPVAWKIKFKYDRPENCPEQIITPYDYIQLSERLKSWYEITPLFTKPKDEA